MKFLLFNLAVIAALVFLFNPDKADFHALADRAYETVGLAKVGAEKVAKTVAEKAEQDAETQETQTVEPTPKKPEPKPVAPAPKKKSVAEAPEPAQVTAKAPPTAKSAPQPPVRTETAPTVAAASEPTLDPAVAQRRAEVLGLDAPAAGPAEEKLMSPEQRRRELFSLAEEMELFYVKRLNR